jgi:dihydroneopterin aldolase
VTDFIRAHELKVETRIGRISDTVGSREWRLIEHIAEEVAQLLLQEYEAESVNVEIIKEVSQ